MPLTGTFTLELVCDASGCTAMSCWVEYTRMEAKEKARIEGWFLSRYGKILCPSHAQEYRDNRYHG